MRQVTYKLSVFTPLRHVILGLALAMMFLFCPAQAQDSDEMAIYRVTDVAVDVTADSAAHARDQAIMQAQRTAFEQLLSNLGTDPARATKENDNAIAAMVQAFEVQKEQTSAIRYIGTFTVQFKPSVVRDLLNKQGVNYSEERSKPMVILPVVSKGGHNILWEDNTKWRGAWEGAASSGGRVPLVVPQGGLDDVAIISAEEAIDGKTEALQNLMNKYQAGGVLVAVLKGDVDQFDPKQPITIDVTRYDDSGRAGTVEHPSIATSKDARAMTLALNETVKQIRNGLENKWMELDKAPPSSGPLEKLPVSVPIASLMTWNDIKNRLGNVPAISKMNVTALARGMANIELEYRGDMTQLQTSLAQQNLVLQASASGSWTLHTGVVTP